MIYQSLVNPSDIFVKTIPGTGDFKIPSVEDINNRFECLAKDYITITNIYNDTLAVSNSSEILFALRTK